MTIAIAPGIIQDVSTATATGKDTMTTEKFTRQLRNLESMYRRLDRGELTGRNSSSSDRTREATYRMLAAAVADDARTDDAPLCTYLDDNPGVAARWNRIERRAVGARA